MEQADILKKLREKRNISIQELSTETGISIPMLRHLESGRRTGTIEILTKLSKFYNVSIDYITCNPEREELLDKLVEMLIEEGSIDLDKPLTNDVKDIILKAVDMKLNKIRENKK